MVEVKENLGAVIRASWLGYVPDKYVFSGQNWHCHGQTFRLNELIVFEVLNEGYVEPDPEPKNWATVVRDADGDIFARTGVGEFPWIDETGGSVSWSDIVGPTETIYDGVTYD